MRCCFGILTERHWVIALVIYKANIITQSLLYISFSLNDMFSSNGKQISVVLIRFSLGCKIQEIISLKSADWLCDVNTVITDQILYLQAFKKENTFTVNKSVSRIGHIICNTELAD